MPWVKFDDQYHQSRKLRRAGREAMWVHFTVTVFCARHLTDGYIDPADIEAIAYDAMLPDKRVREAFSALAAVGALHVLGEGWTVHLQKDKPKGTGFAKAKDAKGEKE